MSEACGVNIHSRANFKGHTATVCENLFDFSALKVKAAGCSETYAAVGQTTRCCISERHSFILWGGGTQVFWGREYAPSAVLPRLQGSDGPEECNSTPY